MLCSGAMVVQGAQEIPGHGEAFVRARSCDPEVGQPGASLSIDENVRGLHIAVPNPMSMGVVQGRGYFGSDACEASKVGLARRRRSRRDRLFCVLELGLWPQDRLLGEDRLGKALREFGGDAAVRIGCGREGAENTVQTHAVD